MEMAEDQDFTFPATTESPPSFFESPPFWPRPTSNEYEDRSFNLCSCQECKANNFNQNSSSYATESPPSFTESPQLWRRQPYFPVTLLGNSAGFNLCSCKECKANNFNQNISSHDAAITESPPLWRQPFSPINQLGNSAGNYKNKEYEEKFNLCSCQECKATNFNQINSSSNATTTTTESVRNSGSFRKEEKFNSSSLSPELKASNNIISQRKSSSGDYNGQEDKMDILWENLNEEISRTSGKNMPKEIDNYPSPGRDVQISCVKALKLSKVNRNTLSRKKASVLVFMRVLKRGFAMHRSRRSIKRRTW